MEADRNEFFHASLNSAEKNRILNSHQRSTCEDKSSTLTCALANSPCSYSGGTTW